jgi:putative ABC transport system permease protein
MIQLIFKTLWNQRRKNGWILIEMILVGFFLWKAIGMIFLTEYTAHVSPGYSENGVFRIELMEHQHDHDMYHAAADNDSARMDNVRRIINTIRQCPEVTSFFVLEGSAAIPNYDNYNGVLVDIDTASYQVQTYSEAIYDGGSIFKTYEIRDAYTGKIMEANKTIPSDKSIYISKCLADKYYKKANPIGKTIKIGGRDSLTRVAGVFSDVQTKNENVPDFLAISQDKLDSTSVKSFFSLCFRIKPNVDEKTFEEHFRRDIAPRLSVGNYYMMHLQSLKEIRKGYEKVYIINRLYYNMLMSVFFLLCTFIGMVGTFWIRCNNRRGEIGIMKSMGASQSRIVWQFLTEAWMLTTVAFLLAILWRLNVECYGDFFHVDAIYSDSPYLTYHPVTLFLIYSGLTYLVMLVIALIGTYIPVQRAAKTLPAEALRDE